MTTVTRLPRKSAERLLPLLRQVDSVELMTVSELHQCSTVVAFELDPLDAQVSPGLLLRHVGPRARPRAGVVVRARRSQGKGDDSVVKLRPIVPAELPKAVRRSPGFSIEVDASPRASSAPAR